MARRHTQAALALTFLVASRLLVRDIYHIVLLVIREASTILSCSRKEFTLRVRFIYHPQPLGTIP